MTLWSTAWPNWETLREVENLNWTICWLMFGGWMLSRYQIIVGRFVFGRMAPHNVHLKLKVRYHISSWNFPLKWTRRDLNWPQVKLSTSVALVEKLCYINLNRKGMGRVILIELKSFRGWSKLQDNLLLIDYGLLLNEFQFQRKTNRIINCWDNKGDKDIKDVWFSLFPSVSSTLPQRSPDNVSLI